MSGAPGSRGFFYEGPGGLERAFAEDFAQVACAVQDRVDGEW
jgi:hypothetical protein